MERGGCRAAPCSAARAAPISRAAAIRSTAASREWPAYDKTRRATMLFNDTCEVVDDPGTEARRLWQRLEA